MILFIVNLAGAVALLLWAVRLIRTGVERAFMAPLRDILRRATGTRATAALAGTGAALLLQSSTAVAMLTAAFAATGSLQGVAGVALVIGADFGSALIARILVTPLHGVIPLLLIVGVSLFLRSNRQRLRQAGRILVGLALVLLSLSLLSDATAPLRHSQLVDMVLGYLASDLISSFILGAVIGWAMHSSVATVLMLVTFAAEGLLPGTGAAALVLGVSLGGALIPVELTLKADITTRRIMLGNVILRGGGAVLALLALIAWPEGLAWLGDTAGARTINLHVGFNLAVVLVTLVIVPAVVRLTAVLLPDAVAGPGQARFSALDEAALDDPRQALANAAREVLRMGEEVRSMLRPVLGLFRHWEPEVAERILVSEDAVDRMHFETKLYVARLMESPLTPAQSRRALEIAAMANNLEEAGDQISTNLMDLATKMRDGGVNFSEEGWRELTNFHDLVLSNAQLALNVMISADLESARQLVEEKDRIRAMEQRLQVQHLERLREGNVTSVESSNIHQETVRALKLVNTAFSYVAYPLVEQAGDLLATRLSPEPKQA